MLSILDIFFLKLWSMADPTVWYALKLSYLYSVFILFIYGIVECNPFLVLPEIYDPDMLIYQTDHSSCLFPYIRSINVMLLLIDVTAAGFLYY